MKTANKLTKEQYKREINRVRSTGKTSAVHKSDTQAAIEQAYDTAVQTLRDLQSFNGDLFLGRVPFDLKITIHGQSTADGTNVYKGIEDALNKLAWYDDQQNQHFRQGFCEGED